MQFRLADALPVWRRTPAVLRTLLADLPPAWTEATEGPGTWSPHQVVAHLILGDQMDWVPRVEHILRHGDSVTFPPFSMDAHFAMAARGTVAELLETFAAERASCLDRLAALNLAEADLARTGRHPEFGIVTMRQHLATWLAHDLGHVAQVVRAMARQYTDEVGPWRQYLSMLRA